MPTTPHPSALTVILFSTDLMLISTVGNAATDAGHGYCTVSNVADLVRKLSEGPALLCLDLGAIDADPIALASKVSSDALRSAIAFGPHVHTAKLDAARHAGFGRVVSRGQFVSKIRELLTPD
jgi:hypothetical protein